MGIIKKEEKKGRFPMDTVSATTLDERREAIAHVIEAVKQYVRIVEAFRFEVGDSLAEPNAVFDTPRGHEDLHDLASILQPELETKFKPLSASGDVLRAYSIDTGFQIGTLYGARLFGATDDEIQKLGDSLLMKIEAQGPLAIPDGLSRVIPEPDKYAEFKA